MWETKNYNDCSCNLATDCGGDWSGQAGWRCFGVGVLLGVIVRTETSLITFKDSSYHSRGWRSLPIPSSLHCFHFCMPRLLKTSSISAQRGRTCPGSPLRTGWVPPCIVCSQGSKAAHLLPASLSVQLLPTLCSPVSYCSC